MTDLPLFKDLNHDHPVAMQKNGRIIDFFPLNPVRGAEDQRWRLQLAGYSWQKLEGIGRCYVYFQGLELGGTFSKFAKADRRYLATFETVIPVPEYWGDPAGSAPPPVLKKWPHKFSPVHLANAARKMPPLIKMKFEDLRRHLSSS